MIEISLRSERMRLKRGSPLHSKGNIILAVQHCMAIVLVCRHIVNFRYDICVVAYGRWSRQTASRAFRYIHLSTILNHSLHVQEIILQADIGRCITSRSPFYFLPFRPLSSGRFIHLHIEQHFCASRLQRLEFKRQLTL